MAIKGLYTTLPTVENRNQGNGNKQKSLAIVNDRFSRSKD